MRGKIAKDAVTRFKVALGKTAIRTGYNLEKGAIVTGQSLGKAGKVLKDTLVTDTKKVVKATANAASGLLREDKANSLLGYRMKNRGIALVAGAGVIGSIGKETKSYYENDLIGRRDGYVTPHAPSLPGNVGNGYGNFGAQAGATGDLVFALNKNRRG